MTDILSQKRAGVNEVISGSLYQRGHFLTWPYAKKWQMLDSLDIDVVVNLWRPIDSDIANPGLGRMVAYLNWPMMTDKVPENTKALVAFVAYLIRQGHTALIHCEAGVNRSAWLCARVVREVAGVAPEQALSQVQQAIPKARINPALVRDVLTAPSIYRSGE
jgi:hypothetical protein